MTPDVQCQAVGRFVTPPPVLLQRLHHNPVQVAAHQMHELRRIGPAMPRHRAQVGAGHRAQLRRRRRRFLLADRASDLIQARSQQFLGVKRRPPGQQFIKQHAQAVDVAPRVNVRLARIGLLGTHVGRRANELFQGRENRLVRQLAPRRLGNPEIYHLGHSGEPGSLIVTRMFEGLRSRCMIPF